MVGVPQEEILAEEAAQVNLEVIKQDCTKSMLETLRSAKVQEQVTESMELLQIGEHTLLWKFRTDHGENSRAELAGLTLATPTALMLEPHLVEEVLITVVLMAVLTLRLGNTKLKSLICISERVRERIMGKMVFVRKECTPL